MSEYKKGFDDGYKVAEAKLKYHTKYIIDGYDVGIKEFQEKLDIAVEALGMIDAVGMHDPYDRIVREALLKLKGEK